MLQLDLTARAAETNPVEIAIMLDSFSNVLMWIFFIVLAIIFGLLFYYIKKNAPAHTETFINKHN